MTEPPPPFPPLAPSLLFVLALSPSPSPLTFTHSLNQSLTHFLSAASNGSRDEPEWHEASSLVSMVLTDGGQSRPNRASCSQRDEEEPKKKQQAERGPPFAVVQGGQGIGPGQPLESSQGSATQEQKEESVLRR